MLACASLLLSRRRKPKSIEQAKKVNKHSSKKVGKQTATEADKKDASKAKIDEVKDAKWVATVQLAITALDEAEGDLSRIGTSKTLQDALLAALKRAHLPAFKTLHAQAVADRRVAMDLLNASTWSFAYAPVTKLVMPKGLTRAQKRACFLNLEGVKLLVQPMRAIPKSAASVRAWYNKTYDHPRVDERQHFTALMWSRTGESLADALLHPTLGQQQGDGEWPDDAGRLAALLRSAPAVDPTTV